MLLGKILSSVRYFATVRRAIGMPRLLKISTISLSLNDVLASVEMKFTKRQFTGQGHSRLLS
jgi:hypothetical protein